VGAIAGRRADSTERYGRAPAGLGSQRERRQPFAEAGSAGRERKAASGVSVDETLARVEQLFARTEDLRSKLEQTEDPDAANDILEQLTELLKEVEGEIRKARQQAESAGA
jgi:hypothetical protein